MKKIYTYILMVACTILFVGCQKDFDGVLTAEIENYNGNNGKVYINASQFACWHNGDKVKVNDSEGIITITEDGNANTATIENVPIAENGTYRAVYPFSCVKAGNQLKFNQIQEYRVAESTSLVGGGHQVVEAPMVALNDGSKLQFKNLFSIVAVSVMNMDNKKINFIEVTVDKTNNDPAPHLWGTTTYTYDDVTTRPSCSPLTEGSNRVILTNIPSGNTSTPYYIVIPPVANVNITVSVVYVDETNQNSKVPKVLAKKAENITIAGNHLLPVSIDGDGTSKNYTLRQDESGNYLMASDVDLDVLGTMCEGGNNTGSFKQEGPITITTSPNIENFKGTYDGNGQTITNNSDGGVFHSLGDGATVKNMKVDANITNTQQEYQAGIVANMANGNVVVDNCVVDGTIEISGNRVGGIVGSRDVPLGAIFTPGMLVINKCVNKANVKGTEFAGGIIGRAARVTIINCANHGEITGSTNVDDKKYVGGLCGWASGDIRIYNSYSDGKINNGCGIIGISEYILDICNVYAYAPASSNPIKWIVSSYKKNGIGSIFTTIKDIYSPSEAETDNGCSGVTMYKKNDWMVSLQSEQPSSKSLVEILNANLVPQVNVGGVGYPKDTWVGTSNNGTSGQPKLSFEVTVGQPQP